MKATMSKKQFAIISFICLAFFSTSAFACSFPYGHNYYQNITFTETADTNYTVFINLNSTVVGANFNWSAVNIVSFQDTSCNNLSMWVRYWNTTNTTAKLYVKVPSVSAGANTITMYYGNASATDLSDITAAGMFGDDFVNGSSWTTSGTVTFNGSNMVIYGAGAYAYRNLTFGSPMSLMAKAYETSADLRFGTNKDTCVACSGNNSIWGGWNAPNLLQAYYNAAWNSAGSYSTNDYNIIEYRNYSGNTSLNTNFTFVVDDIVGIQNAKARNVTAIPTEMVFNNAGAAHNSSIDWVFVRKYHNAGDPSIALGAETGAGGAPASYIFISYPTATTYYGTNTANLTFYATDNTLSNLTINAYLNGTAIYTNSTFWNYTTLTLPRSNFTSGSWNYTVIANGSTNISSTVLFNISNGIYINVTSPAATTYYGNSTIWLNFSLVDNTYASANISAYLNGTLVFNGTLSNNSYLNVSTPVSGYSYNFSLNASNTEGITNTTNVLFDVWYGLNISAVLANGTSIPAWKINISNATTYYENTSITNYGLIPWYLLPNGSASANATKAGYDSEAWSSFGINSSMGILTHSFTLYPYSFVYMQSSGSYLSDWYVNFTSSGGTNYIATSVSSYYNISNRNLTADITNITGYKAGYYLASENTTISNSTSFNVTLYTNSSYILMRAYDEITRAPLFFNVRFDLKGTNTTDYYMTAYRNAGNISGMTSTSGSCLWDGSYDECFHAYAGDGENITGAVWNIQGFDYNNATFKAVWSSESICDGVCSGNQSTLTVYDTDTMTPLWTKTIGLNETSTDYITIANTNGSLDRAANLTLNLTSYIDGGVGAYNNVSLSEFSLYSVSPANYSYVDNYTLAITTNNLGTGYTIYDGWFRGEETQELLYTYKRMYRLAFSLYANYSIEAYLLKDSLGYLQYFNVLDGNNNPIEDALLSLSKWYSGILTTVAQCGSNPAGACSIFLAPLSNYGFTATATNYNTKSTNNTVFTGSPNPANIYLTSSSQSNFTTVFEGITVSLMPASDYSANATNATCQIVASEGNINFINFTAYMTNSTTNVEYLYNNTYTAASPSGATLRILLNDTGRYRILCNYQFFSNATGSTTTYNNQNERIIWITSSSSGSMSGLIDPATGTILVLGFIAAISGIIFLYSGSAAFSAIIGAILMLMLAYMGWMSWNYAILAVITVISIVILRSGI